MTGFFDIAFSDLGDFKILHINFHRTPAAHVFQRLFEFFHQVSGYFFCRVINHGYFLQAEIKELFRGSFFAAVNTI